MYLIFTPHVARTCRVPHWPRWSLMPRPIMLGIVGDSGLREDHDHPRPRPRARRRPGHALLHRRLPPLRPQAARRAEHHAAPSRLQPPRHPRPAPRPPAERRRDHEAASTRTSTARSRAPDYFVPGRFVVTEGLHAFSNPELREMFDVRVYLDPPEELRRHWKVQRDCSRRGYTTDQVLARARPPRARLGGVHPAAAPPRRHRRLVPAGRRARTRSTSTASSRSATRCRTPTSPASSATARTASR